MINMKIGYVVADYKFNNEKLQPWNFISSKINQQRKDTHFIFTDCFREDYGNIHFIKISNLNKIIFKNSNLIKEVNCLNLDEINILLGPMSILKYNTLKKLKAKKIGLFLGSFYSLAELINSSIFSDFKEISYFKYHILNAMIPKFLFRYFFKRLKFEDFIVLSEKNYKWLSKCRIKNVTIDKNSIFNNIQKLPVSLNKTKKNQYVYFGPPLAIRGFDNLVKAFNDANPGNWRLIICARLDDINQSRNLKILDDFSNEKIILIDRKLDIDELKEIVSESKFSILPFKIVQSEMPISILQSICWGTPVITSDVSCIKEYLPKDTCIILQKSSYSDLLNLFNTPIEGKKYYKLLKSIELFHQKIYPAVDK